jgi:TPR repeat protein
LFGIEQKPSEAVIWYKKAAELGLILASNQYALCLINGVGVEQNPKKGFDILVYNSNNGSFRAYYFVAECIFFGDGIQQKKELAIRMFLHLQNRNWNPIYFYLGFLFFPRNFALEKNMSCFAKSPSLALEFFHLFTNSEEGLLYSSEPIQNATEILLCPNQSHLIEFNFQRKERNYISKSIIYEGDDAEPDNLYIEIFNYHDYTMKEADGKRIFFLDLSTKLRRNPLDLVSLYFLAMRYLNGDGTQKNISKAETIFRRLHSRKMDVGTLWLLRIMNQQQKPLSDLYQVCLERADTQNGLILYKIGQGHILNMFGNQSNVETGITFLEKSISQGYKRAIRLLCITKLKQRFGFEKRKRQLFQLSKQLRQSDDFGERSYYGVCLVIGIGIKKNVAKGMKIVDLSSIHSEVGGYFHSILIDPTNCYPYSLL